MNFFELFSWVLLLGSVLMIIATARTIWLDRQRRLNARGIHEKDDLEYTSSVVPKVVLQQPQSAMHKSFASGNVRREEFANDAEIERLYKKLQAAFKESST